MSIEYSISTYCMLNEPMDKVLDTLSEYTKSIEIMYNDLTNLNKSGILSSYNFNYSIHSPLNVNIASISEEERKLSIDIIKETFSVASEINAPVVIHPGTFSKSYELKNARKSMIKSLSEIYSESIKTGVVYYIENMNNKNKGHSFLKRPRDLRLLNKALFCLDVGHANVCGALDKFLELPFSHIHIHDNDGKKDSHSPVGCGNINFEKVIEKIKKNNIINPVIEVKTLDGVLKSLDTLKELEDNM